MHYPSPSLWEEEDDVLLQSYIIAHHTTSSLQQLAADFADFESNGTTDSSSLGNSTVPTTTLLDDQYHLDINQLAEASIIDDDDAHQVYSDVSTPPELAIVNSELADICSDHHHLQAASHDVAFCPWSILHSSDTEQCSNKSADFLTNINVDGTVDASVAPSNYKLLDHIITKVDQVSDCCDKGEFLKSSKSPISLPQDIRESSRRELTPTFSSKTSKDVHDLCLSNSKNLKFDSLIFSTSKRRKLNCIFSSKKPTSTSKENPSIKRTSAEDNAEKSCNKSSKNLAYEQQRRRKINENLYALRLLVPKISKMDKASIVSDAIAYVESLKNQIDEAIEEIEALKSWESIIKKNLMSRVTTLTSAMKQVEDKILKAKNGLASLEPSELKDMILRVALMFGLGLAKGQILEGYSSCL